MPSDATGKPSANRNTRALPFKHDNEIAQAHYYGVTFENGIKTEVTPTDHAAMMRFTFKSDSSNFIFDNVSNSSGITLDPNNGTIQVIRIKKAAFPQERPVCSSMQRSISQ